MEEGSRPGTMGEIDAALSTVIILFLDRRWREDPMEVRRE